MRNRELSRQIESINSLLQHPIMATGDIEILGHLGRYLCVLTAGFLESSVKGIYGDFIRRSSIPPIERFALADLRRIRNPKARRLVDTAGRFKSEWANDLETFLNEDDKRRWNAIDSIMNNRNQIAHGGAVGISVDSVREYLPHCIEVVEFIERQVQGN